MNTIDKIEDLLRKKKRIATSLITDLLGISRQASLKHLRILEAKGKIIKIGKTRGSYYIPNTAAVIKKEFGKALQKNGWLKNENISEYEVLKDIKKNSLIFAGLNENLIRIFEYSFTEMLNNAIDHSDSSKLYFTVKRKDGVISFCIKDWGVGVYANIRKKFNLASEWEAVQELVKGKNTTDPEHHTGEGIFFTSRIADTFILSSHKIELFVDNRLDDFYFKSRHNYSGTIVEFAININSNKKIEDLFAKYTTEEYAFDKNIVRVSLFKDGENYVSRSQAKRLLNNLEKYRSIILDFKGIPAIGQGFADQVFRVFQNEHPEIKIEYVNCDIAVEMMIKRTGIGQK